MKKKVLAVVLGMSMVVAMMTGCGGSKETSDSSNSAEKTYTIGISQFAEHGSLDNCREGFIEGLKEEGLEEGKNLKIVTNNADADTGTAAQIADQFVADKVDMICAIATPSAQAAYNAAMETDIPVVYTAVTNPVAAELANDDKSPVGNVTGTSDELPVEAQLKMIREILPDAKTIGILYTTSEANSVYSIEQYEKLADKYGFKIEKTGITNTSEIQLAASDLLGKVDCLTNLTDNTVVSALPTVLGLANEKGIPVFGSEIEQVKLGCLAAEGIEYTQLGKDTGKMAAKILKGEASASEMDYELITESSLYVNEKVAENLGITVPDTMKERAVESFTEITEN
ncbi:ABC transporter substrate-binding protein [Firmicutes bacterium AM41-5BH]|jgi:putative ABC transport system substrate-binding protein|nr:ABC transporter substrate-binding protein [Firmicutes bacterium AM41-5BH]